MKTLEEQIEYLKEELELSSAELKRQRESISIESKQYIPFLSEKVEIFESLLYTLRMNIGTLSINLGSARITPEQIDTDQNFLNNLQSHLADWEKDLKWTERELLEQAIIDAKEGKGKSNRYLALEKNEHDLKAKIANTKQKLEKVQERVSDSEPNHMQP